MALLDPLAGWLTFAALMVMLGSVAVRWALLPNADLEEETRLEAEVRAARIGLAASVSLLAALSLVLARQLIDFRDPFVPLSEDLSLLVGGTAWGAAWSGGVFLALVAAVAFGLAGRGLRSAWWVATPVTVALTFFPGSTGHAAAAREEHALALAADALHVTSAGIWAGGLTVMLLLAAGASASGRNRGAALLRALVPCFTPLALVATALVVLSGVYATWLHVDGLDALLASGYGRVLLAKLVAVAAAMLAGAINWRRQRPLLLETGEAGPMRRTATVEAILVQLVLLLTAILARTAPPA